MAFLVMDSISKTYGAASGAEDVEVLRGISETVEEGEFVSLMGPSGSGKSTLLTIVGAMNRPTSGRLLVDGIDVYALSDEARADFRREYLGFVFQQHHLMPYLSAEQNVMLPLAVMRLPAGQKHAKAMAALNRVGLDQKASRMPNQLSGGEQGRLAIARAIVNEPPLILADEPTGALDSHIGSEIMRVFLDLNAQGQTVFMVTHSSENAALADRILHIRDGQMERACTS